jgi:hypothetical protein
MSHDQSNTASPCLNDLRIHYQRVLYFRQVQARRGNDWAAVPSIMYIHVYYTWKSRPEVEPATSRIWQHRQHWGQQPSQIPLYKIEGSMTRVVRSAPQYPARNPDPGIRTRIICLKSGVYWNFLNILFIICMYSDAHRNVHEFISTPGPVELRLLNLTPWLLTLTD